MKILIFPGVINADRPEMLERLMDETGMAVMLDYDHHRQRSRWYLTPKAPEPTPTTERQPRITVVLMVRALGQLIRDSRKTADKIQLLASRLAHNPENPRCK